ncbi:MAG: type II toxin-antitoxin system prevent-host-death family antitoxin [Vicinamibacterales bacterium]
MATVSAFEAKTRFGELLDRVSKGEEVVITRG